MIRTNLKSLHLSFAATDNVGLNRKQMILISVSFSPFGAEDLGYVIFVNSRLMPL
jgi:hypothetical protein